MSQIGIDDQEELLAQLGDHLSPDQIQSLATNPDIYRGLAQISAEYNQREAAADKVLAQIESREDPNDLDSIATQLSQLDTQEIESISRKLNANSDMSFAQVASMY